MDTSGRRLTDDQVRAIAREAVQTSPTARHAARKLGVSREAALALAAGAYVRPATFALVRERLSTTTTTI
jgi:hypothetical protein